MHLIHVRFDGEVFQRVVISMWGIRLNIHIMLCAKKEKGFFR